MKTKDYSKIRIKNPGSDHVVVLHPRQKFSVTLKRGFNLQLEDENFIYHIKTNYTKDEVTFEFEQVYDLTFWTKLSKVFLADITFVSEESCKNVCVILDTSNPNKENLYTAINPERATLKLGLSSVLNVVIFQFKNSKSYGDSICKSAIFPSDKKLSMEQISYSTITPKHFSFDYSKIEDPFFAYPRSFVFNNDDYLESSVIKEHHFWFRWSTGTLNNVLKQQMGSYSGGSICFTLDGLTYHLNLTLNHKLSKPVVKKEKKPKYSIGNNEIIVIKKNKSDDCNDDCSNPYQTYKSYCNGKVKYVTSVYSPDFFKRIVTLKKIENNDFDGDVIAW